MIRSQSREGLKQKPVPEEKLDGTAELDDLETEGTKLTLATMT
jgi:hypothetical protein